MPGLVSKLAAVPHLRPPSLLTDPAVVAFKAIFLKHNLVAIRLQRRQAIRRLGQHQPRLGRVAPRGRGRLGPKELVVPNLGLHLPVDNVPLLDGPLELDLAVVSALVQLRGDVDLARPVARDAVGNHPGLADGAVADEPCLERIGTIVEDEGRFRLRWPWRDFCFSSTGHLRQYSPKTQTGCVDENMESDAVGRALYHEVTCTTFNDLDAIAILGLQMAFKAWRFLTSLS